MCSESKTTNNSTHPSLLVLIRASFFYLAFGSAHDTPMACVANSAENPCGMTFWQPAAGGIFLIFVFRNTFFLKEFVYSISQNPKKFRPRRASPAI